jgi:hypothetical protein
MKKVFVVTALVLLALLGILFALQHNPRLTTNHEASTIESIPVVAQPPLAPETTRAGPLSEPLIRDSDSRAPAVEPVDQHIRNYEELWAQLDPGEQDTISAFSARYSDGLRFYNNGQLQWMQRHGYPMPEDILAAQQMDDEELTKLAASGNTRAMALLVDRLISRSAALGQNLLAQGIDPFADQDFFLITLELMNGMRSLYASGTPFAGYMDARSQMEVYGIKTPPSEFGDIVKIALQGLAYAESNGDHLATNRALWLADEAGVDPDVFHNYVSYHGFLRIKREILCDSSKRIVDSMPYGTNP